MRKKDANPDTTFVRTGKDEFNALPSVSIDYAVIGLCPDSIFPSKWFHSMRVGETWGHGMLSGTSYPKASKVTHMTLPPLVN